MDHHECTITGNERSRFLPNLSLNNDTEIITKCQLLISFIPGEL